MEVLIIEDEIAAVEKLTNMLVVIDPSIQILGVLESVDETVAFLKNNRAPELAFVDIQLADDVSFKIFEQIEVHFPVIFTTAYDDYILKALEHNSIDYLLKPIEYDRLEKALQKVKKLESHFVRNRFNDILSGGLNKNKKRFLVKKGTDIVPISINQVAYFFTEHKVVFLKDREGTKYIIDKTISEIADELGPEFFRANRKYVVHIDAIEKFKSDNGKVLLSLQPASGESVTVSKENAPNFRKWIEQE